MKYDLTQLELPEKQQLEIKSVVFAARLKSGTLVFHSQENEKIVLCCYYNLGKYYEECVKPNSFIYVVQKPSQNYSNKLALKLLYNNKVEEVTFPSTRELYKYFDVYQVLE